MSSAPVNPKQIFGDTKIPLQLLPPLAEIEWAAGHADGATKYGPYNWHENPVEAMTYVGAIRRHTMLWAAKEQRAEDSGVHHLGHVMASAAILIDAEACGQLIDNRPALDTGVILAMKAFHEKMVKELNEKLAVAEKDLHDRAVAAAG